MLCRDWSLWAFQISISGNPIPIPDPTIHRHLFMYIRSFRLIHAPFRLPPPPLRIYLPPPPIRLVHLGVLPWDKLPGLWRQNVVHVFDVFVSPVTCQLLILHFWREGEKTRPQKGEQKHTTTPHAHSSILHPTVSHLTLFHSRFPGKGNKTREDSLIVFNPL